VLGAAVRLAFVLGLHRPGDFVFSDMWVYDHRAHNLLSGDLGPWDTFTPCGYPAWLAFVYSFGGPVLVGVLHALMGGLCAALTHRIALRMWPGEIAPLAAGLATALHLPLVFYSGLLLTEGPSALMVVLTTWLLLLAMERKWAGGLLLAGLSLGVAAVVRPNLLVFYLLLPIWLWRQLPRRRAALAFLLIVAGSTPPIVGAAVHNTRLLGAPSLLGTNGGLNFYLNFSEVRTIRYRDTRQDHAITPIPNLLRYEQDERSQVPFYDDGYYYHRGLDKIAERPLRALRALRNIPDGLGVGSLGYWPGWKGCDRLLRDFGVAFFWLVIFPALAWVLTLTLGRRLWKPELRIQLLLTLWIASSMLVMYLFLGDPRIRVPFDPLLWLLATDAYHALILRLRSLMVYW
jgi:4-amino-4-deoxy-L-arabinose transferase-like glycosyltransferase